jgi:hypothetical protein
VSVLALALLSSALVAVIAVLTAFEVRVAHPLDGDGQCCEGGSDGLGEEVGAGVDTDRVGDAAGRSVDDVAKLRCPAARPAISPD